MYEAPPCERLVVKAAPAQKEENVYSDRLSLGRPPAPGPLPGPPPPRPPKSNRSVSVPAPMLTPDDDTEDLYVEPLVVSTPKLPAANRDFKPGKKIEPPTHVPITARRTHMVPTPFLPLELQNKNIPNKEGTLHPSSPEKDEGGFNAESESEEGASQRSPEGSTVPTRKPMSKPPAPGTRPKPAVSSTDGINRRFSGSASKGPQIGADPEDVKSRYSTGQGNESSLHEQNVPLSQEEWYTDRCDRKTAEAALERMNKDGAYLVRRSSGQDRKQPYTLVVFYKHRVYNIPIRYLEKTSQYVLGKEGKVYEEYFDSVAAIISHHQRVSLVLVDNQSGSKEQGKLMHPVQL
nr:PREDICTED: SH2 domain-containing protein 6 [Latimeria chalumnae]|eukprot:XP_005995252.1 PREDICTED: SH2 domain-containing protein 6 [Latimeria chalumnae]